LPICRFHASVRRAEHGDWVCRQRGPGSGSGVALECRRRQRVPCAEVVEFSGAFREARIHRICGVCCWRSVRWHLRRVQGVSDGGATFQVSTAVLADAQFSTVRVFRPLLNFESVYEGQSGDIPIAIPGQLDQDAGKTGFDANVLAGIPVTFGAKMVIWMPTIFNFTISDGFVVRPYRYTIVWRLRNLRDFRTRRAPYHFPRQSFGENNEFIIPSGVNTVITNAEPRSVNVSGSQF